MISFGKYRFLAVLCFLFSFSNAQFDPKSQHKTDSLNKVLAGKNYNDTCRAWAYLYLSEILYITNLDTLRGLSIKAEEIAKRNLLSNKNLSPAEANAFRNIIATASNNIAVYYSSIGRINEALIAYQEGLEMYVQMKNPEGEAAVLNNAGGLLKYIGDLKGATENFYRALSIYEKTNNKEGQSVSLNFIGLISEFNGDNAAALEFYNKSLRLKKELNDDRGIALALDNIAALQLKNGNHQQALDSYSQSYELRKKTAYPIDIATSIENLGQVYLAQKNFKSAKESYTEALKIYKNSNARIGIVNCLHNIAEACLLTNDLPGATQNSKQALETAKQAGYIAGIESSADLLAVSFMKKGDFKQALEMRELNVQMRDSINNEANKNAGIKNQLKYQYEKISAADSVRNAEMQKVKDAKITAQTAKLKQEKTQFWFLVSGLLFVMVGLGFVVNRFRITRKQKEIIEKQKVKVDEAFEKLHEKNKEVMDSIHYARRIQSALFTPEKYIDRKLNSLNRM